MPEEIQHRILDERPTVETDTQKLYDTYFCHKAHECMAMHWKVAIGCAAAVLTALCVYIWRMY